MATNFIPSREADLLAWANNFATLITADPTAYGLDAIQATTFSTYRDDFATAYTTSVEPTTRTPPSIVTKRNAKAVLIQNARLLARIVQADPSVTDTQIADLGLTVRDDEPTPVPVPDEAPAMDIVSVTGRIISLRLHDPKSASKRGKPAGVQGATVLSFVGDEAPADIDDWTFEGSITRTTIDVEIAATVPGGSKVWLTAFWFNPRLQSGPAAAPLSTRIGDGLSQAA